MASRLAIQPRAVVGRELDGFPFQVLVLRLVDGGGAADVAYTDDGNIERAVPLDELVALPGAGGTFGTAAVDRLWGESMAQLAAEEAREAEGADVARRPTEADAEVGRYHDGAVVIMTAVQPAQEQAPAVTAAAEEDAGDAEMSATEDSMLQEEPKPLLTSAKPAVESVDITAVRKPPPAVLSESASSPQMQACGAGLKGIRSLRALHRDVPMVA